MGTEVQNTWEGREGAEPYQGVGDDEGHPAEEQEGAEDDGGDVLEHGVHGGLGLGGGMSKLFLHILRNGGGRIRRSLVHQVDNLVGERGVTSLQISREIQMSPSREAPTSHQE